MIHELKTWAEYFDSIVRGDKTFEVRRFDRDFRKGDILLLNKYDKLTDKYLGAQASFRITYILKGGQFGIENDYCVLGIKQALPMPLRRL